MKDERLPPADRAGERISRADELRPQLALRYPVKVPGIREHVWFIPEALSRQEAEGVAERLRRRRCHQAANLLMEWVGCRRVAPLRSTDKAQLERNHREVLERMQRGPGA